MKKRDLERRIEELERRLAEQPITVPQIQPLDDGLGPPCEYCLGKPYLCIFPICTCGRRARRWPSITWTSTTTSPDSYSVYYQLGDSRANG